MTAWCFQCLFSVFSDLQCQICRPTSETFLSDNRLLCARLLSPLFTVFKVLFKYLGLFLISIVKSLSTSSSISVTSGAESVAWLLSCSSSCPIIFGPSDPVSASWTKAGRVLDLSCQFPRLSQGHGPVLPAPTSHLIAALPASLPVPGRIHTRQCTAPGTLSRANVKCEFYLCFQTYTFILRYNTEIFQVGKLCEYIKYKYLLWILWIFLLAEQYSSSILAPGTSVHNHTHSVWRSSRWIPAKLTNRKNCTGNWALCFISRFREASFSSILKTNILFKNVCHYIFKETSLYKIWACLEYEYSRWVS